MSTLNVHDIQGFSTYGNNVRLPNGHQLQIEGNLKLPSWTTSTRPSSPEVGQIGFNSELARYEGYDGNDWVGITDQRPDGSSADQALDRSIDIMDGRVSNPSTGWYYLKINGVAKQVWIDTQYDGGGWVLVGSHPRNVSIPALTYAQTTSSTDWSASSSWGNGDPKQYAAWAALDAWTAIATANNVGKNVVYYVANSQVPLGSTGSHSKRARWTWTGWGTNYNWVGAANLNVELSNSGNPGVWSYHISNNYNWSTIDRDQDQNGGSCPSYYNSAPWWYGSCWSGSFWGGNGQSYTNSAYWNSSGGDNFPYGAYYVK